MIKEYLRKKKAQWAMEAARAEHVARLYEAAQPSENRSIPRDIRGPNSAIEAAGTSLRRWGRYLDENHDLVIGLIKDLVINTVGGLQLEPMGKSITGKVNGNIQKFNDQLAEDWRIWCDHPTLDGRFNFQKSINLLCRSYYRDGEALERHYIGRSFDHPNELGLPYSFQPMEADFLPHGYNDDKANILNGIQYNALDQETAFYLYKDHPGELNVAIQYFNNLVAVPADQITFIFHTNRLGAGRGISILHGVITRLDDLKDLEESERLRARFAASQVAAITRGPEYDGDPTTANDNRAFIQGEGITVFDQFGVGEKFDFFNSNTPNDKMPEHNRDQIKRIAAGTGGLASNIARDYSGTYSSQRQELVTHVLYKLDAQQDFIGHAIERRGAIWRNFLDAELQYNKRLSVPKTLDIRSLYNPLITVYPTPWIDPQKETEAFIKQNESGLTPKTYIMRSMGYNPRHVEQEFEKEWAKQEQLNDNEQETETEAESNDNSEAET